MAQEARVSESKTRKWLTKQAIWQIYLPFPKYIPRPTSANALQQKPNDVHQADLLFLSHDTIGTKVDKYALTISDEANRFKEAEPLTNKNSDAVRDAFEFFLQEQSADLAKNLKVDPGKEFMASVNVLMSKKGVTVQRGEVGNHRAQGIVKRFNRILAERLFSHQYAQEMSSKDLRSREWVKKLPLVIMALNDEETRLIRLRPKDAIKIHLSSRIHPRRPIV